MSSPAHIDRSSTEIKAMQLSDARDEATAVYFRSNCEPVGLFVGIWVFFVQPVKFMHFVNELAITNSGI